MLPGVVPEAGASASATPAADPMIGKKAGKVRSDNGLKMKFVWCPPGKCLREDPTPRDGRLPKADLVEVTLTNGFCMGQTEVTQEQWEKEMETAPWAQSR